MTEALLQKLEEKMMLLLGEVEDLRKEVVHLRHETSHMKAERENHTRKLTDLLGLLDAVNATEKPAEFVTNTVHATTTTVRPVIVQKVASFEHNDSDFAQSS